MRRKPRTAKTPSSLRHAAATVFLAAFLLYLPSVSHDFTFDDWVIVANNAAVQEGGQWRAVLWDDYWPGTRSALYRPLTILSFALERSVHGPSPAGFHFVNVLLHALVSLLVYRLAALLAGPGWPALAAGLLFAVHPLHTEAVSGIVGRAELLSAFWLLLSLLLWARPRRFRAMAPGTVYTFALCAFVAGMAAKEHAIILPAVLLIYEAARAPAGMARQALVRTLGGFRLWGFVIAALLFLVLRGAVLGGIGASLAPDPPFVENPLAREPAGTRVLNALANQWHGLRLHAAPHPLIADYSYETLPVNRDWMNPGALAMAFVFGACAALWLTGKLAWAGLRFGVSFYLIAILPSANLLFPIGTVFGERLFYLPSVGLCLAAGSAVAALAGEGFRKSGRAWRTAILAVTAAFALLALLRLSDWKNDRTLFTDTVAKAPRNVKALLWLGDALVREGDHSEAIEQYRRALEIHPEYGAAAANIMVPYIQLRRYAEAVAAGEKARQLFEQENPVLLYNLALACQGAGNVIRFIDYLQRALEIDPRLARAHAQLGVYYFRQGSAEKARTHLGAALRLEPSLADAPTLRSLLSRLEERR